MEGGSQPAIARNDSTPGYGEKEPACDLGESSSRADFQREYEATRKQLEFLAYAARDIAVFETKDWQEWLKKRKAGE